jgi:hypothetical protein
LIEHPFPMLQRAREQPHRVLVELHWFGQRPFDQALCGASPSSKVVKNQGDADDFNESREAERDSEHVSQRT